MTETQTYTIAQAITFPQDSKVQVEGLVLEAMGTRNREYKDERWLESSFKIQDATGHIKLAIQRLDFDVQVGMILRAGPAEGNSKGTHVRHFRGQDEISTNATCVSVYDFGGQLVPKTPVAVAAPAPAAPVALAPAAAAANFGFVPVGPAIAAAVPAQPVALPISGHPASSVADLGGVLVPVAQPPRPAPALPPAPRKRRLDVAEARHIQEFLFCEWQARFEDAPIEDVAIAALVNTITIAFLNGKIDQGELSSPTLDPLVKQPDLDHEGESLPEPPGEQHPLGPGPTNEPDWPR